MAWIYVVGIQTQPGFLSILNKEGKVIVLPKNKTYELNIPKASYKTFTPAEIRDIGVKLREFAPDTPHTSLQGRPMDVQISSAAYQPFFNIYTPTLREVSPMALDFSKTYVKWLNESFDLVANGVQHTWPGVGGMTIMNGGISWRSGSWSLYGGGFGGCFFGLSNPNPGTIAGTNVQLGCRPTNWLRLKGWGQYAYYTDKYNNPHMPRDPFFYHTQTGGVIEFKITDNF